MANPILAEVTRGALTESVHRGALVVRDADGGVVLALGDTAAPVFPRSAVKLIQALPLVESGAADGWGDEELALACASHSGEPMHVARARAMLARGGRDATCLECGAHWPMGEAAARELAASGGRPGPLHNNCSGKHAGFLCLADALGAEPRGYVRAKHPVQEAVRGTLEAVTGGAHGDANRGTDGCGIPTYAVPLDAVALGFARLAGGTGIGRERARAAARLRGAAASAPLMVAGTGRFDTVVTAALGTSAYVKMGAEGVHVSALPDLGLGVALKCDDGALRAAEAAMAALLLRLLAPESEAHATLTAFTNWPLVNCTGTEVGRVRAAEALAGVEGATARLLPACGEKVARSAG